jgi:hypothetical protein
MNRNPHIGSRFEDFLEEEGIREIVDDLAIQHLSALEKGRIATRHEWDMAKYCRLEHWDKEKMD